MNLDELKSAVESAVDPVMTAFEQFKETNDARLDAIEKKGAADVLLGEKVDRIEKTLSNYETLNQQLTLAKEQAKKAAEASDRIEVMMAKLGGGSIEKKSRTAAWARGVFAAHAVGVPNLAADERKCIEEVNAEYKALNMNSDAAGAYLAPSEFVRDIQKTLIEISPMRSMVNVRSTTAKSIQQPKRTSLYSGARWVSELGTKTEVEGLAYGLIEIPTHETYSLHDISNQMLEDSAFDIEAELRNEATEQFAIQEGRAVLSGTGVGQPEGILTATGIPEVVSGGATSLTSDGLLNLFYGLKTFYSRNGMWGLNRLTIAEVRKLKDGLGNYVWMPGLQNGVPNSILGAPYVEIPDMPNIGAGTYPIAFGDWRKAYTLVDRITLEFLRDPYTQATGGLIRFILRKRVGGQVMLAEALVKQKVAAS